jgi:hypothetical protein
MWALDGGHCVLLCCWYGRPGLCVLRVTCLADYDSVLRVTCMADYDSVYFVLLVWLTMTLCTSCYLYG